MLSTLGFVGMASAQDSRGLNIQTYDHLCTGAFLKSSGISHAVISDELPYYASDTCESCTTITINLLDRELTYRLMFALLERAEVFGAVERGVPGLPAPYDVFWSINEDAQKPVGGQPPCFSGLDPILNNIVRNIIGSPNHDSIPAPYDHANTDDLIGVIINTHEPARMQEYLKQNGAVTLSTTVLDGHTSMETFVPVSLLIPLTEQHHDVEVRVMVVGKYAIIHTGDWYYDLGVRSVWRTDVDRPTWYSVRGGNVGVINVNADRALAGDELPADIQNRCYYTDGLDTPDEGSCKGNVDARTVEILTNSNSHAKLYVVDTSLSNITSIANWLFDKGVDTIHMLDDVEALTLTISRAYHVQATEPSSPSNHEPILDVDDAVISQGDDAVRHWFSVQDDDLDDRLVYNAMSSSHSIAGLSFGSVAIQMPGHDESIRSGYLDIIPRSVGTTKITISVSDGASVVTDTFVVNVTDNTSPHLKIDRTRFSLVVGEAQYFTPVAVDPDGDTLSYEILEPVGGFGLVSLSISNDMMTLTPIVEGENQIEITVSDGKGGYDHGYFRVCVVESNSPPQLSPIPSRIAVPVGAETIAIQVIATDTDGDKVGFPTIVGYNRTVANIELPYLGSGLVTGEYFYSTPCSSRYGVEQHHTMLFITPNAVGNTTATVRASDTRSSDSVTFQVIVYEPSDSNYDYLWDYRIPRDVFPP